MIDKPALLKLLDGAEAVYLATISAQGPRIRALVNLRRRDLYPRQSEVCRPEGFTLYFSTSISSAKVREIKDNPSVAVYYCAPAQFHGVMLSGKMEILTDPGLKSALWDEGWRIFWPGGADDPDYVVLRLKPAQATGWWDNAPFHLELSGP